MKYTETHEWVKVDKGSAIVGISGYAQKELGDIVYVELPEKGTEIQAGEEFAVLESTKAAADIYAPVSGTIIEVNNLLEEQPELINQYPEDRGWIVKISLTDGSELDKLLAEADYQKNHHC